MAFRRLLGEDFTTGILGVVIDAENITTDRPLRILMLSCKSIYWSIHQCVLLLLEYRRRGHIEPLNAVTAAIPARRYQLALFGDAVVQTESTLITDVRGVKVTLPVVTEKGGLAVLVFKLIRLPVLC